MFGLQTGLSFSLSLMKEMKNVSPVLLTNTLNHLYSTLCEMKTGSLYMTDKTAFQNDAVMGEAREFLMSLIEGNNMGQATLLDLCYKIILRMGLIRQSPEDFLLVNEMLSKYPEHALKVDLRDELREIANASGHNTESEAASSKDEAKHSVEYEFLAGEELNCLPMTMKPYDGTISRDDQICTNGHNFWWRHADTLYKANIVGLNGLNFKILDKISVSWPTHS